MKTFTNRNGESVSTDLGREELVSKFAEIADENHWLWFWMIKTISDAATAPALRYTVEFLADSFMYAIGMGMKAPKIRAHFENRRYKIAVSRKGTLWLYSGYLVEGTHEPTGDEFYVGSFARGQFWPARDRVLMDAEQEFLDRLIDDPVGFLAECGKDMDRCCYCGNPLEDPRSKEVGYGKICAGRWGLPWGSGERDDTVKSFAEVWRDAAEGVENVRAMFQAVRKDPYDVDAWRVLGDALIDAGHRLEKLPQCPERRVTVPHAA